MKRKQINPDSNAIKAEPIKYEDIVLKAKFLIEYDVDLTKEFEELETIAIDIIEINIMARGFADRKSVV